MFKPDHTVFAMIQPSPLPGSYRHQNQNIEDIVKEVLLETKMISDNGFDGVILQNMNDMPIKQTAAPEAIAYMTRLGFEIKKNYPKLALGVLVNWDGVASFAVADAIGADFIRIEHLFTGASVTSAGILQAQCVEVADIRKRTKSNIPVYVDIQEVHGVPLGKKPIGDAAWEAVFEAFADGLFVSGKTKEDSLFMIHEIRKKLPDTPIILGGGATGDNINELMREFDGVSVATWIKNGDMKNPIDPERAKLFLSEAKKDK
ncbi:MAG: BtpA/SgcQ family protein [Erysipelotrichaceae bacterium]